MHNEGNYVELLAVREAQLEALESGAYLTVDPGTTQRLWPSSPQGYSIVFTSPRLSHGRMVEVAFVLRHGDYPEIASAREDQLDADIYLAGEAVRTFNSLEWEERKSIWTAARDRSHDRHQEARERLRYPLLVGVRIDERYLLHLAK